MFTLPLRLRWALAGLLIVGALSPVHGDDLKGLLQITVLDENGRVAPNAHVYIYGKEARRFIGAKDIPGQGMVLVRPGAYRLYAAATQKTPDQSMERFASHEAHVRITGGDHSSVLLHLKRREEQAVEISGSDLRKIGVPTELAQHLP